MKIRRRLEEGFTLIESMVSAAILAIAILGASMQYVSQVQAEAGASLQIDARLVLNQVKNEVISNPAMFPMVFNGTNPISYVGCFQENGAKRANNCNGQVDYVGIAIAPAAIRDDAQNPGSCSAPVSAFVCNAVVLTGPPPKTVRVGGVEVHITWINANRIQIDAIVSPHDNRQFKVPVSKIQQFITL